MVSALTRSSRLEGSDKATPCDRICLCMCMERLSQWISSKVDDGTTWRSLWASRGGVTISHLFFADDILLFAKAAADRVNMMACGVFTRHQIKH